MEENMIESNVDPKLILVKVQIKMTNLSINPQHTTISRNGESLGTRRGLFYGKIPNVRSILDATQIRRDK